MSQALRFCASSWNGNALAVVRFEEGPDVSVVAEVVVPLRVLLDPANGALARLVRQFCRAVRLPDVVRDVECGIVRLPDFGVVDAHGVDEPDGCSGAARARKQRERECA